MPPSAATTDERPGAAVADPFLGMMQRTASPLSRLVSARMLRRVERMENDRAGMPAQQNVVTAIPIGTHPVSLVLIQCHYLFSKSVFGEFPAAILRFSVCDLAVVALVFQSGKIVVNGVRTDSQIIYVMHIVYDMLKNAGALHPSSFVCVITVSNRVFTGRMANNVDIELLRNLMSTVDYRPDNLPLASCQVPHLVLETGVTDALRALYVYYFGHEFRKGELPVCPLMTAQAARLRETYKQHQPVKAARVHWSLSDSDAEGDPDSGGGGGGNDDGDDENGGGDDAGGKGGQGVKRKATGDRPEGAKRRKGRRTLANDDGEADTFRENGSATWLPTRTYTDPKKKVKVVIPESGIVNMLNCPNSDAAEIVYWFMGRVLGWVPLRRPNIDDPDERSHYRKLERLFTLGYVQHVAPMTTPAVLERARQVAEQGPVTAPHWQDPNRPAVTTAPPRTIATTQEPARVAAAAAHDGNRALVFERDGTVAGVPFAEPRPVVAGSDNFVFVEPTRRPDRRRVRS